MPTRLGLRRSNLDGVAWIPVDYAALPAGGAISAGSTWYFQLMYRDPLGPGGSGFNLTDGVRIPFGL